MTMQRSGFKATVSGVVQGVWFRKSTQEVAKRLGIKGHAKNLPNGDVEVIAIGETTALKELEKWLWHGPSAARVDEVSIEAYSGLAEENFIDFRTG